MRRPVPTNRGPLMPPTRTPMPSPTLPPPQNPGGMGIAGMSDRYGNMGQFAPNHFPSQLTSPTAVPVIRPQNPVIGNMKKGGKVNKTGIYKLHKGEKVVPARGVRDVVSSEYDFRNKKRG